MKRRGDTEPCPKTREPQCQDCIDLAREQGLSRLGLMASKSDTMPPKNGCLSY